MFVLYRVEDKDGNGPYTTKNGGKNYLTEKYPGVHMDQYHPHRRMDMPEEAYRRWVENKDEISLCCCTSINNLLEWFYGYLLELMRAGFRVYRITATQCDEGLSGMQAFVNPEHIVRKVNVTKQILNRV